MPRQSSFHQLNCHIEPTFNIVPTTEFQMSVSDPWGVFCRSSETYIASTWTFEDIIGPNKATRHAEVEDVDDPSVVVPNGEVSWFDL